jgi:hypothetical protein
MFVDLAGPLASLCLGGGLAGLRVRVGSPLWRSGRGITTEPIKFLIDLHARESNLERACAVACEEFPKLAAEDVRRIIDAALEAQAGPAAVELSRALLARTSSDDDSIAHAYALAQSGRNVEAKAVLMSVEPAASACLRDPSRARLRELAARLEQDHSAE